MTDKEKIVEIILNVYVPKRAADRIADALIENGIGDVTEWKNRVKALCKKLREVKE